MSDEHPPIGIDLGTTYSVIAYLDGTGRPITVPNESGDLLTASAVFVDEDEIVVGKEAVKASVIRPEAYSECFKRDVGSASFRRKLCGQNVPPEILSALVLDRLRRDAQRRLGPLARAVITVPAFFDENRRRSTQNAGRLAGLDVLDIINEPTAAAIAYGYDRGFWNPAQQDSPAEPQRLLVYDLGSGTFDVTILEIHQGRFRTLATDGDVRLGGKDFDERLVAHLAEQFLNEHGVDPRSDPQDAAQLWIDAQEAKHSLSERTKTTVVCFHAGLRMRVEVSRGEFEELTADLVERTEVTASLVIRQAGLQWPQIDRVLLVGGSSRMPAIRQMLRKQTGKEPDCTQSPDESVAHGAALYAGTLLARDRGNDADRPACELVNVNAHSLGVVGVHRRTHRKTNVVLIPKNTQLPAQASRIFSTARPDQRNIRVAVVEGESERPEDCIALGECTVRDLPAGLPAGTKIEVEYRYAANGRIAVAARIPSIRHSAQVTIDRGHQAEVDDLKTWRARLLGKTEPQPEVTEEPCDQITIDWNDPARIRKRLDLLHARIGKAAMRCSLPESAAASQQAARSAAAELADALAALEKAQRAAEATLHDAAALHQAADVSRAKTAYSQARARAEFACVVLGRECVACDGAPPGVDKEFREAGELRQRLQRLGA